MKTPSLFAFLSLGFQIMGAGGCFASRGAAQEEVWLAKIWSKSWNIAPSFGLEWHFPK
jgi:hypothetical protein